MLLSLLCTLESLAPSHVAGRLRAWLLRRALGYPQLELDRYTIFRLVEFRVVGLFNWVAAAALCNVD
jgi:hypothetical protein